jgi:hypothetical protein
VGPSGWGKTSLTLELVRRGWLFLSDDFAPIFSTGLVAPFPRRVSLTDASLALLGLPIPDRAVPLPSVGGRRKWMTDIEDLLGDTLGEQSRVSSAFVMGATPVPSGPGSRWRLKLSQAPSALLNDLAQIDGVAGVEADLRAATDVNAAAIVDLRLMPGAHVTAALDAACARHEAGLLAADVARWSDPSFESGPSATALTAPDAVSALLQHSVTASARSFMGAGAARDAARDHALLSGALAAANATVFRLSPGPLYPTADLVEELAARSDRPGARGR